MVVGVRLDETQRAVEVAAQPLAVLGVRVQEHAGKEGRVGSPPSGRVTQALRVRHLRFESLLLAAPTHSSYTTLYFKAQRFCAFLQTSVAHTKNAGRRKKGRFAPMDCLPFLFCRHGAPGKLAGCDDTCCHALCTVSPISIKISKIFHSIFSRVWRARLK